MAMRRFFHLAEAFQSLRGTTIPTVTHHQNSYLQQFNKLFSTTNVDLACGIKNNGESAGKCSKENKCKNGHSKWPVGEKGKCPSDVVNKCSHESSSKCSKCPGESSNKCSGEAKKKCPVDPCERCPACPCPTTCGNGSNGNGKNGKKERLCSQKKAPGEGARPKPKPKPKPCPTEESKCPQKVSISDMKSTSSSGDTKKGAGKKPCGNGSQKDKSKKMGNCKRGQPGGGNGKQKNGSKTSNDIAADSQSKNVVNATKNNTPPETLEKYQEKWDKKTPPQGAEESTLVDGKGH
ncbi:uncharacterized protein LOC111053535 isoform X2 [Nilaparvata lugens]|uniref:uncharacterized protein LOC111053535 isoform X2 n=1 Tax=Nilaparvata lugens TaxID=108931 RepID=UPI00193D1C8C|nr:uncharacterized protein LOC111053535 isoform X2 [Nilaparvata lugens]